MLGRCPGLLGTLVLLVGLREEPLCLGLLGRGASPFCIPARAVALGAIQFEPDALAYRLRVGPGVVDLDAVPCAHLVTHPLFGTNRLGVLLGPRTGHLVGAPDLLGCRTVPPVRAVHVRHLDAGGAPLGLDARLQLAVLLLAARLCVAKRLLAGARESFPHLSGSGDQHP